VHNLPLATRQRHEREVEKLAWLATNGYLTEAEIEVIERKRRRRASGSAPPANRRRH
jgi:hypothetical protein